MRHILFLVLVSLTLGLSSCASARESREKETQAWIQSAQRPISVQEHSQVEFLSTTRGHTCYTLIDQKGNIHFAKNVRFKLPAVIE